MMQCMTRYVLFELIKIFSLTLIGMTSLVVLIGLAHQAIREGLGPIAIAQLIPYVLPNALRFSIPGTILFATCSVYGRMSSSNEVVAIKSVGISPWVIMAPALVLAFVLSLVSVWLNDLAVSWGRSGMHRVVLQSVEQIMYGVLRTQRSYSTDQFSINVKDVEGRFLILPTITYHPSEEEAPIIVTADRAELKYNREKDSLTLLLEYAEADVGEHTLLSWPDTLEEEIPLSAAAKSGRKTLSTSEVPLRDIGDRIELEKDSQRIKEEELAIEKSFLLLSGDFAQFATGEWMDRRSQLQSSQLMVCRLRTEPWRRWAYGFSCFVFVFVGSGLAIRQKSADFWSTFGLCFLPILICYYPLLEYGVGRAKHGVLPPYAVWIANVVMLVVGGWILKRVLRY